MVFRFPATSDKTPSAGEDGDDTNVIKVGLPEDFKEYKFPMTPPRDKNEPDTPRMMTPRRAVTPDNKPTRTPRGTPDPKPLPKTGNRQRSTTKVGGGPPVMSPAWAKVKGRVRSQTRAGNSSAPPSKFRPPKLHDKLLDSGKFSDKMPSITSPLKHSKTSPHKGHLGIPGGRKRSSPEAIQRRGSFFDTYIEKVASRESKTELSIEKTAHVSVMSTIGELTGQLVQLRKKEEQTKKERDIAVGSLSKVSARLEGLEATSLDKDINNLVSQEKGIRDVISWSASLFLLSLSGVTDPVLVEANSHRLDILLESEEIERKKIDATEKVDWQVIMSKNLNRKHTAIVLQLHRTHGELTDTRRELAKAETEMVTQERMIRELQKDAADNKIIKSPIISPRSTWAEGSRLESTTLSPPSAEPPSSEVTASVSVLSPELRADEWDARTRGQVCLS